MKNIVLIIAMLTFCFPIVSIAQSNIIDVILSSKDHTTFITAVKATDLVNTLKEEGPFTVFAPTNTAFDALSKGTVTSLLKPGSKSKLSAILNYHIVAGNFKASDIVAEIEKNQGMFTIKTINGSTLNASLKEGHIILTDASGNIATITTTDLKASNGIIHTIDSVVLPN